MVVVLQEAVTDWGDYVTIDQVRADIEARSDAGQSFEQIDQQVIESANLPDDEVGAMWLYAWSIERRRRQRRLSRQYLGVVHGYLNAAHD